MWIKDVNGSLVNLSRVDCIYLTEKGRNTKTKVESTSYLPVLDKFGEPMELEYELTDEITQGEAEEFLNFLLSRLNKTSTN